MMLITHIIGTLLTFGKMKFGALLFGWFSFLWGTLVMVFAWLTAGALGMIHQLDDINAPNTDLTLTSIGKAALAFSIATGVLCIPYLLSSIGTHINHIRFKEKV